MKPKRPSPPEYCYYTSMHNICPEIGQILTNPLVWSYFLQSSAVCLSLKCIQFYLEANQGILFWINKGRRNSSHFLLRQDNYTYSRLHINESHKITMNYTVTYSMYYDCQTVQRGQFHDRCHEAYRKILNNPFQFISSGRSGKMS